MYCKRKFDLSGWKAMDDKNIHDKDEDMIVPAILLDEDDVEVEIDITEIEIYEENVYVEIEQDNVIPLPFDRDTKEQSHLPKSKGNILARWQYSKIVPRFLLDLKQKYDEKSYSKKQKIFGITVFLLTVLTVVGLLMESPIFKVDKIELNNISTTALSEEEIANMNEILSTRQGEPIYRTNLDQSLGDLEEFYAIKNVSIEKDWPSTLIVNFERRTPFAYINTDKGVVLLDSQGFVFAKANEQPQGIASFDGIDEITLYETIEEQDFIEIINAMPQEIRGQVTQVKLQEDMTFHATLNDGITIKIGQPTQLDRKLAIAWSIILAKDRSDLGYIDVSVPNLPVSGSPELQV